MTMQTLKKTIRQEKMFYVDLHTHTTYSDGSNSPAQNIVDMAMIGMQYIAITDHDTIAGFEEARAEAKKWGVSVISGVEITTEKYHILGYDFDVKDKRLGMLLTELRKSQEKSTRDKVEILRALGVPITFEKIKIFYPHSRLGKVNLLVSMITDPECREYHKDAGMQELSDLYFSKRHGAPLSLMNGENALSSADAISAIYEAGGISILAHPFKDVKKMSELDQLVAEGITGLEIQPNYSDRNIPFKEYAERNRLLITYGSDYHGARKRSRPLLSRGENILSCFWKLLY